MEGIEDEISEIQNDIHKLILISFRPFMFLIPHEHRFDLSITGNWRSKFTKSRRGAGEIDTIVFSLIVLSKWKGKTNQRKHCEVSRSSGSKKQGTQSVSFVCILFDFNPS